MTYAWSHGPRHFVDRNNAIMVTGATYFKQHYFSTSEMLALLQRTLIEQADHCRWNLDAWSVFSNHYHFIALAEEGSEQLSTLIRRLHSITAHAANANDGVSGRHVWHQYWDTSLTTEGAYLARLKYCQENAVKHRLVTTAQDYPFCSTAQFRKAAPTEFQRRLSLVGISRVAVVDLYSPLWLR